MYKNLDKEVQLPENVEDILNQDFWICRNLTGNLIPGVLEPVKFYSSVCIFVSSGRGKVNINFTDHEVEAPSLVHIRANQVMQKNQLSDDFKASFIVMSKRLVDDIMLIINNATFFSLPSRFPMVKLTYEDALLFEHFYDEMEEIMKDSTNPNLYQTVLHTVVSFFYRTASRCYKLKEASQDQEINTAMRIADRFTSLVEKHFRDHRFLDFYAEQIGVSAKHLSRTLKSITGRSASQWIERYTILEAKVQLRYSNKTVQQISEELKFPTQSFFGKYFKKAVGMSPKEFRNSKGVVE